MTFTSPLARIEPPRTNPELAALNSWLDYNRASADAIGDPVPSVGASVILRA